MTRTLAAGTATLVALAGMGAAAPTLASDGHRVTHRPEAHHASHHAGDQRDSRSIHRYVNLGDSYSAGVGLEPLAAGSPAECRQASINHAHLLAKQLTYRLTDVSCSGADTSDFFTAQHPSTAPQLAALDKHTDLVTMMIGGNDSSVFSKALNGCSMLGYQSGGKGNPCTTTYGKSFETTVRTTTYPALLKAFRAARAKAPKAKVAVIGYPRLLPKSGSCFPQMLVADGDVAYVNSLQSTLNDAIKRAARATGVTYVDAYAASTGHDACQAVGVRWVEPVVGEVTKEKAHPNALGEAAIADLTRKALHLR